MDDFNKMVTNIFLKSGSMDIERNKLDADSLNVSVLTWRVRVLIIGVLVAVAFVSLSQIGFSFVRILESKYGSVSSSLLVFGSILVISLIALGYFVRKKRVRNRQHLMGQVVILDFILGFLDGLKGTKVDRPPRRL